jgi:hypothetical protein
MNKAPYAAESSDIDPFAVLSATWVLASNDDNPLMFYESIHLLIIPIIYIHLYDAT